MNKIFAKDKKKKKNVMARFLEWVARGNKKQAQKGNLCKS